MRKSPSLLNAALVALASFALTACGTSQVHIDPKNVADLRLELPKTSGEPSFCPGEPIKIQVIASLNDGTQCSNVDAATGCMGQKDAVIDVSQIRVEGSAGALTRNDEALTWLPARDALVTAETGLKLQSWLEDTQNGQVLKSKIAEAHLRPDYHCMEENVFSSNKPLPPGQNGGPGPDLKVAATTFSTPYYPEAALIRVDYAGGHTYIVAPLGQKPIKIISKGQNGAQGVTGPAGRNGQTGRDGGGRTSSRDGDGASAAGGGMGGAKACKPGAHGTGGTPGGPGGKGGNGGDGGSVQLILDEAVADKLKPWIVVESAGGAAGPGGNGGPGGMGGKGGLAALPTGEPCSGQQGQNGPDGAPGTNGAPGLPGKGGEVKPAAVASREALFGPDLPAIQRIESAKAGK